MLELLSCVWLTRKKASSQTGRSCWTYLTLTSLQNESNETFESNLSRHCGTVFSCVVHLATSRATPLISPKPRWVEKSQIKFDIFHLRTVQFTIFKNPRETYWKVWPPKPIFCLAVDFNDCKSVTHTLTVELHATTRLQFHCAFSFAEFSTFNECQSN